MTELIPSTGPPSFGRASELYPVVEDFLRRAGLRPGEKMVIFTDTRKDKNVIEAFFAAGLALEAEVEILMGPPLKSLDDPPPWVLQFLKQVDLVINLLTMEWGKQEGARSVVEAGVRVAMCVESATTLLKMRPNDTVLKRVTNMVKLLEGTGAVTIKSRGGTNLVWQRGEGVIHFLNGLLDAERRIRWTNFPNSIVNFPFAASSGNGPLVVEPGDVLIHLRHMVREPIRLTLQSGKITAIDGGYDAQVLRRKWFDRWADSTAPELSHLSLGCDHRAELLPNVYAPMEWESYAGGVLFGFGPKTHLDIMLASTNVWFDELPIIAAGKMVHPDLR